MDNKIEFLGYEVQNLNLFIKNKDPFRCRKCNGCGRVVIPSGNIFFQRTKICPGCNGTGKLSLYKAKNRLLYARKLKIIREGWRIFLKNKKIYIIRKYIGENIIGTHNNCNINKFEIDNNNIYMSYYAYPERKWQDKHLFTYDSFDFCLHTGLRCLIYTFNEESDVFGFLEKKQEINFQNFNGEYI